MSKHWMQEAFAKNKGKLHRHLGVPEGEKIPAAKLAGAAERGGSLAKEANLARVARKIALKHMRKGK